jgi:hypothetical protein
MTQEQTLKQAMLIMLANQCLKHAQVWDQIGPDHVTRLLANAQASVQRKVDKITRSPELDAYIVEAGNLVNTFAAKVSNAQNADTLAKIIAVIEAAINGDIGITADDTDVLTYAEINAIAQLAPESPNRTGISLLNEIRTAVANAELETPKE